jgi:hypothetical protein
MPYISIDSLDWIEDPAAIPSWILGIVENSNNLTLDFSQGMNPMTRELLLFEKHLLGTLYGLSRAGNFPR